MLSPQPSPVKQGCPSGKPSFVSKWVWGNCGPTWDKDLRTLWLLFGGLALILWATGLDTSLAKTIYHPNLTSEAEVFATFLRRNGTLPGAIMAILGLIMLLWPKLWQKRPLLYRTAMVVTLTAVLGVGLVNQLMVKKLADRPRPTESVLHEAPTFTDGFRGNSMPSGHAAMGFLLAAPFFPLRRSRPKLATTFLATGLVAGSIVGLSRMMLGAHFATDVLIAGAITLSAASLFALFANRISRIHPIIIGLGILVAALAVILGNKFTLTLTLPLNQPVRSISLPCQPISTPQQGTTTPTLTVILKGYGAPLSYLKLTETDGIITLQRHFGLYHHLSCTATLAQPAE